MDRDLGIRLRAALLAAAAALAPASAWAGPITAGVFYEFSFGSPPAPATGCDPADPGGNFCIPSSGTPTSFLDAPPWTFTAPAEGAELVVVDAFESGDIFYVYDGATFLGATSLPGSPVDCGDDPVPCLAVPGVSRGTFALGVGDHSITLSPYVAPSGGGSGYLKWAVLPEPGSLTLFGIGLVVLAGSRRRLGEAR
jgi:hypothetical protein